jgi:hypothetical protein
MYKRTDLLQLTIRLSSIILNKILKTNRIPKRQHRKHSKPTSKMKTTSIITAITGMLAFGTQNVQAKCFGDGATWPNREVRKPIVTPEIVSGMLC